MVGMDIGSTTVVPLKAPFRDLVKRQKWFLWLWKIFYVQGRGAKSFADDLDTGQSVVFSRAATILRSIETKLLIGRFVFWFFFHIISGSHTRGVSSCVIFHENIFFLFKNFILLQIFSRSLNFWIICLKNNHIFHYSLSLSLKKAYLIALKSYRKLVSIP